MYTPWRYNTNNGFAFHTRTGRSVAEQIKNPPEMDGMKLCFRFSKNIDQGNMAWNSFSDKIPSTQGLYINSENPPETKDIFNNNEDPTSEHYSIGYHSNIGQRGNSIKDYCFFGKDLSYIEPGLTGVEGATAFMKCDPSQTFDCGFEPQMIITKSLEVANNWKVFTKEDGFKDVVMRLSASNAKYTDSMSYTPTVNGSKITAPSATSFGSYLIIAFAEVVSVPADNKTINTLAKSSPGTSSEREVDMGMDFVSEEKGGMVITKGDGNWSVFDTIRGPLNRLQTNGDGAEDSDNEYLKEFTKNGVKVGTHELVNGGSDQFYMGFQTDEKITPPKWKAKSVVFDIADNYGDSNTTDYIRLRSVEFYRNGVLLPFTEADLTAYSTSDTVYYEPKNLFITGKSKTGTEDGNGWRSETNVITNQRIVVKFESEIEFDKVVINNGHDGGLYTNSGAKAVDVQITDFAYETITYGAVVTGSVNRIFKSNILQHSDADVTDDRIYVDISDEWQINRASGFGMCKIQGTGANRVFRTPYGKEPCMLWLKKVRSGGHWAVYFHTLPGNSKLFLNTNNSQVSTLHFQGYLDTSISFSNDEFYLNTDTDDFMIYAWFGDYFQDDATGAVNTSDQKRVMGVKGTSAFFEGVKTTTGTETYKTNIDDIETVLWKPTSLDGHWNIINRNLNIFQDRYYLDTTDSKFGISAEPSVTINGSEITVTTTNLKHEGYIFWIFGRTADKNNKEYIPWMNQTNHIGTGKTDTSINLGLDFSGDNGGMVLQKSLDQSTSWIISDTLRGAGRQIHTDVTNIESTSSEVINEFTESGVKVGTDVHLNKLNSEIATFGFQTTHKTEPTTRTVKSAVFKFEDNWGASDMGIRRIEFYKGDSLINLAESNFTAYVANEISGKEAKHAFITSGDKIDSSENCSWSTDAVNTEQVLIIVFNSSKDIDYIRVHNYHHSGANSDSGVKNTKVYFTDYDYTDTSYSNEVTNSELVYDGVFDQHHASNAECYTQYLYTPWHYNPQTGFGFFTHKGNGTEITIPNVLGKQPTMIWSKCLTGATNWLTYSKVKGENYYGQLNLGNNINNFDGNTFKKINKDLFEFGNSENDLNADYITYVWCGDEMSILGNPQEAFGIVGTSLFTEMKAANTEIELGFEPEVVLVKSVTAAGSWYIFCGLNENVFDSYMTFNTTNVLTTHPEGSASNMWVEGTRLKFGTAFNTDYLVCAFAKNTYKPQGKSIVIHGSESSPSLFSIANGYNKYQAIDKLIGYDRNVVFSFNEGDGTYYIKLNIDGTISLKNENCFYGKTNPNTGQDFFDVKKYKMFSPSGSVTPGIYIGKIVIQNDAILDVTTFQEGIEAEVEWFPVSTNSMYIKENPYFTTYVDWDIWWNSVDSDENMRHVTGQYFHDEHGHRGTGAYKRHNSKELVVGSGWVHTFYSYTSGDPIIVNGGFYKLFIKRKF
ncbi:MAG: hypothetical protein GY760_07475 [Deltaproteobacteria bacterium]|nr:hypothetical protein [Deltaproteobacteria bacterium]